MNVLQRLENQDKGTIPVVTEGNDSDMVRNLYGVLFWLCVQALNLSQTHINQALKSQKNELAHIREALDDMHQEAHSDTTQYCAKIQSLLQCVVDMERCLAAMGDERSLCCERIKLGLKVSGRGMWGTDVQISFDDGPAGLNYRDVSTCLQICALHLRMFI